MCSKLHELATVQMGYSFRSRLETSEGGNLAVIQMKDLLDNNTVDCDDLVRIDMEAMKGHHLAQRGDLVFRARGSLNTAAILLDDPGKAVVSAPLLRIRVTNPDKILPEYLNWYISQRDAQIFLTSRAEGTFLKMISKQMVENLEIELPSLDRQKSIIELATLSADEEDLLHTLAHKRKQYVGAILLEIAKGEMN
ncbi:MAG: restriction endonuclease subunit S [Sphaerochaeta sp.]